MLTINCGIPQIKKSRSRRLARGGGTLMLARDPRKSEPSPRARGRHFRCGLTAPDSSAVASRAGAARFCASLNWENSQLIRRRLARGGGAN